MTSRGLDGFRAIVAGAGLAGLSAARALEQAGATVVVVEARDRVGGRAWTLRDGFSRGRHAEAGADLLETGHTAVLELARELGLTTTRILRRGFGYYGPDEEGRPRMQPQHALFERLKEQLEPLVSEYRLGDSRWDGEIAARLGRTSVSAWLERTTARDGSLWHRVRALRGLFLADPEELSLLALVDFLADESEGPYEMLRIADGNDRLATSTADALKTPPALGNVLRRVRQDEHGVTASVEVNGRMVERRADVLVAALPPTTLRDVVFDPPLPAAAQRAIGTLTLGAATRVLLEFDRRFWRRSGRPTAFGSPYAFGAVWDGNEQQTGRGGILSLLAGGGASAELKALIERDGVPAIVQHLSWLGRPANLIAARAVSWEDDPWAKGGYAVFDTRFQPADRDALARPVGRVFFAGEHTSVRYQGYLNGAVESGRRAAAEIAAARLRRGA